MLSLQFSYSATELSWGIPIFNSILLLVRCHSLISGHLLQGGFYIITHFILKVNSNNVVVYVKENKAAYLKVTGAERKQ